MRPHAFHASLRTHQPPQIRRRDSAITTKHVAIIGAGIGGLAAALDLAVQGIRVTVLERAAAPGGKTRAVLVGQSPNQIPIDAGPTTLTMRWVFDALFAHAGTTMAEHLVLTQATTLARHAWAGEQTLDLHADIDRSADAIGQFAGTREAAGYRSFCKQARQIYETLETPFLKAALPQGLDLLAATGPLGAARLKPFTSLWTAVGAHMQDPRLRQLFSRSSTQYGTPPFQAPAAMMLLNHIEQSGTWTIEGGLHRLAETLAALAARHGATIRTEAPVREIIIANGAATGVRLDNGEVIRADAVVMNGEPAALATGLLGSKAVAAATSAMKFPQRSLSANGWAVMAEAIGVPLLHQNVFFSRDTRLEFDLINSGRLPTEPTITLAAQDRAPTGTPPAPGTPERMLITVNAPPSGDRRAFSQVEIDQCMQGMTSLMKRCGVELRLTGLPVMTTPAIYHRLFPASGGALYGNAYNGVSAALKRPGNRTRLSGLYLAGGSTHPGPGVPLSALSGRLAAASIVKDLAPPRGALNRLFRKG